MSAYIDSLNQAATASTAKTSLDNKTEEVLGKEDFLTLLVAQLQNQDPLNPDDPTEFTAQLAQFSSLEQLFNLNDSMNNLVQSNANSDRLSTLNTIGKEVAYNSNSFSYNGEPVTLGYQLDGQASDVTLALQLDGVTVANLKGTELSSGTHYLNWDGKTLKGEAAPVGDYKIVVSAKAAEGESVGASPVVRAEVTGVDLGGEYGGTLITSFGEVSFNTILGVYDPDSFTAESDTNKENSEENVNNAFPVTDTVNDGIEETADIVTEAENGNS